MKSVVYEFNELFSELRIRSELRARNVAPEVAEKILIKESDRDMIDVIFEEGIADMADKTGSVGRLLNYDGTLIYKLSEKEQEEGFIKLKPLLKKAFMQYCLHGWYDSVGAEDLSQLAKGKYKDYVKDINTNSTKPASVQPNYRPYF